METTRNNNYLLSWVEKQQSLGKYVFTLEQVRIEFPDLSDLAIKRAIDRLSNKRRIISAYRGFFLIIPPEYASKGVLPQLPFIDNLMQSVGKPYYVGLLSAAALHGAIHHQPQDFYVISDIRQTKTQKKGLKINYVIRKKISESFLEKRKTELGYANVSNPELTACDLVYYDTVIGGISRAASVLKELVKVMKPERITGKLVSTLKVTTIQRLGYLLEVVLEQKTLADKLYAESQKLKKEFFRQPLKPGPNKTGLPTNNRWKIVINIDIELK